MSREGAAQNVEKILKRCREAGLRRTRALVAVIRTLASRDTPTTLADLAKEELMEETCDQATIYRILIRLEEEGITRRLGLHNRAAYYILNYPETHRDYLICTECGMIDTLDVSCPVEALEKEISNQSGYKKLYHELEFFGVCPDCA
ncbi:MAG: Fur family transcriptional regulator [Verrucomicrobiota bacterium]